MRLAGRFIPREAILAAVETYGLRRTQTTSTYRATCSSLATRRKRSACCLPWTSKAIMCAFVTWYRPDPDGWRPDLRKRRPGQEEAGGGGGTAPRAATARAGEDIEIEHAVHQGGPGPRARGAGGAGAGLALGRMEVRGRAAVADDVRARARLRGGDGVIHDEVDRGAGDDGRELLQERSRLEEQTRGGIWPDRAGRTRWRAGTCGSTS